MLILEELLIETKGNYFFRKFNAPRSEGFGEASQSCFSIT